MSLDDATRTEIADALREAHRTGTPIPRLTAAWRSVHAALQVDADQIGQQRDEYRQLQLLQIDRGIAAYFRPAFIGREVEVAARDALGTPKLDPETGAMLIETIRVYDYAAADRLLKLFERQARLLGLDAPTRVAVSTETHSATHEMLFDLERMLTLAADGEGIDGDEPPPDTAGL